MNQFLRCAALFLLIMFLSACGTSTNGGDSGLRSGDITGNSSGTLQGEPLGSGASAVTDLRKIISVVLLDTHPDLLLDTAYLTRMSTSSESAALSLAVTNTGTRALCFVWANDLTYLDGASTVTTETLALVAGSVGVTESGTYTSSCLGAGEKGYFIDIPDPSIDPLWSVVDTLQIGSLSVSDTTISGHGGKLVPTDYSVDGSASLVSVTGSNQGTISLYPTDFSIYFLLDAVGEPLEWSFLDPPTDTSLSPGSNGNWSEGFFYYEGSASGLQVHFDYDGSPSTSSLRLQNAEQLTRAEILDLRENHASMLAGQQP